MLKHHFEPKNVPMTPPVKGANPTSSKICTHRNTIMKIQMAFQTITKASSGPKVSQKLGVGKIICCVFEVFKIAW